MAKTPKKAAKSVNKRSKRKAKKIAMARPDALDEIIAQIDPEEVPVEFIMMAKVTTIDGDERVLSGRELEVVMENPEHYNITEAKIILNVRKIRDAITREVDAIFEHVRLLNQ